MLASIGGVSLLASSHRAAPSPRPSPQGERGMCGAIKAALLRRVLNNPLTLASGLDRHSEGESRGGSEARTTGVRS
jgi:hypothetical protein